MNPKSKRRFKILPTPKYLSIRKSKNAVDAKNPRLVLANKVEKVSSIARKSIKKNEGIAAKEKGSTK